MTIERANRLVTAAANSTCSTEGRKRIEAIICSVKQDRESSVVVATGNWNSIYRFNETTKLFNLIDSTPSRLAHVLERRGVQLDWADERLVCRTCGRLVRCRFDCIAEPVIRHCGNTTCESFGLRRDHGDGLLQDRFLTVKVFAVASTNQSRLGFRKFALIAPDGEAWEVETTDPDVKELGETVQVPLLGRLRNFGSLGFLTLKRLPDASAEVVAAVWK